MKLPVYGGELEVAIIRRVSATESVETQLVWSSLGISRRLAGVFIIGGKKQSTFLS